MNLQLATYNCTQYNCCCVQYFFRQSKKTIRKVDCYYANMSSVL